MKPKYLFVVGLPRTGSKLVENILRKSPHINYQSAGETYYMGHLITPGIKDEIKKIGDLSKDANVHKLLDYFYTGTLDEGFWKYMKRDNTRKINVDKEEFLQELLACDRSAKGVYEVILRIHAKIDNETILGDKTNSHIYHVPTLIEWFPQAKIVHMFRDPRAILASNLNKSILPRIPFLPGKPGSPFYTFAMTSKVTFTWMHVVRLHHQYEKRCPQNYRLVKFEDLVAEPEKSVRELCVFLDIEFDPEMLQPELVGSSFRREQASGFDPQTLTRWKQHLKPWMGNWVQFWAKKYLREFGYID